MVEVLRTEDEGGGTVEQDGTQARTQMAWLYVVVVVDS